VRHDSVSLSDAVIESLKTPELVQEYSRLKKVDLSNCFERNKEASFEDLENLKEFLDFVYYYVWMPLVQC
jgi:hypothetical protein